jgi:hypothetical protein
MGNGREVMKYALLDAVNEHNGSPQIGDKNGVIRCQYHQQNIKQHELGWFRSLRQALLSYGVG